MYKAFKIIIFTINTSLLILLLLMRSNNRVFVVCYTRATRSFVTYAERRVAVRRLSDARSIRDQSEC